MTHKDYIEQRINTRVKRQTYGPDDEYLCVELPKYIQVGGVDQLKTGDRVLVTIRITRQ